MDSEEKRALFRAVAIAADWALHEGRRGRTGIPDFPDDLEPGEAVLPAAREAGEAASPDSASCDSLERVEREIRRCAACRLAASRTRVVCGQGVADPALLVVGEGPGAEEDAQGLPFVGPAGRLLDKMLEAIGMSRATNCYIANVVKCRPPMNRDPAPDEQAACLPFLERQAALLAPRAVLAAGRVAARALLGTKDGVSKLRGRDFLWRGVPLVVTYHPSALLRDPDLKRPAWEDLKRLRDLLGDG
jgi:DNA polymerase